MKLNALMAAMAAAALAVAGCKGLHSAGDTPSPTATADPPATPTDGANRTDESPAGGTAAPTAPDYMVMNFRAEVEGVQASGQVRMARDSVLWVAVYKMIELGRAKATRDSIWISAPLMLKRFAGTYAELEEATGKRLSYDRLQAMLLSDQADEHIASLAAGMGLEAKVKLGKPRSVERTEFPMSGQ